MSISDSFEKFLKNELPDKCEFFGSLKDSGITEEEYQRANSVWNNFKNEYSRRLS